MHKSVLLIEAVDMLVTRTDGRYLDATFGRGGHSREILSRLAPNGRLLAIDQDPAAVAAGRSLMSEEPRFEIKRAAFSQCGELLRQHGWWAACDGVLLDLGVSSPQLDEAGRGFSFLHDGPLDMRMNPDVGDSAASWLARAEETEIAWVLKEYGEERFARRMARAIVAARAGQAITRTGQLAEIISAANPAWERDKHPATRAFQGIRIHVNRELQELDAVLAQSIDALASGGRLVVISFHSLEDRRVKRFIRDNSRPPQLPRRVPVIASAHLPRLRKLGKAVRAAERETRENPRARSAILRGAEKLQ